MLSDSIGEHKGDVQTKAKRVDSVGITTETRPQRVFGGRVNERLHTFHKSFGIRTARCSLRRIFDALESTDDTDSARGEFIEAGEAGKDWESKDPLLDELKEGVEAIAVWRC